MAEQRRSSQRPTSSGAYSRKVSAELVELRQRVAQLEAERSGATAPLAMIGALANNLVDAIVVIDPQKRVVFVNERFQSDFEAAFGFRGTVGEDWFRGLPDSAAPVFKLIQRGFAGEEVRFELPFDVRGEKRTFDVALVPVRDGDTVPFVALFSRDVTEQRRSQEQLAEREALFRAAIEGAANGFAVMRPLRDEAGAVIDFQLVECNAVMERILVSTRAELLSKSLLTVVGQARPLIETYARVLETGVPLDAEFFLLASPGPKPRSAFYGHQLVTRVGDQLTVTLRDLTARKAEEASLAVNEHLRVVGRIAASLAHEINNPLASVVANIETTIELARQNASDEQARRGLEPLAEALGGLDRICRFVEDLLEFTRPPRPELLEVDLARCVTVSGHMAAVALESRAKIALKCEPKMPRVYADPGQLCFVLVSVLMEAVSSVEATGAEEPRVALYARSTGDDRVVVVIDDSGRPDSDGAAQGPFASVIAGAPDASRDADPFVWLHQGVLRAMGAEMTRQPDGRGGTRTTIMLRAVPVAKG